jgi:hypothetical protein
MFNVFQRNTWCNGQSPDVPLGHGVHDGGSGYRPDVPTEHLPDLYTMEVRRNSCFFNQLFHFTRRKPAFP